MNKTTTKARRRRTPAKDAWLRVRVTRSQLEAFDRAAEVRGKDLSEWVRDALTRATLAEGRT
jgi:uncharacterized protein (DUF1778 family)